MNAKKEADLKLLIALFLLTAGLASALEIPLNNDRARTATVTSATATFFKVNPDREGVLTAVGTGSGTFKMSSRYDSVPSNFGSFVADPAGAATAAAGWRIPSGMAYVGLDVTSGTWVVTVSQPK